MSDDYTVPSDPKVQKKIRDAVYDISAQLQMIQDRREAIKEMVAAIHEEVGIPKKVMNKMARTHFKGNYQEVAKEDDVFQLFYETLLEKTQSTSGSDDSDDHDEED